VCCNGTFIRSAYGTILGDVVKIHRVRLSDEEIVRIARALKWFSSMLDEKGLMEYEDRVAYRDLFLRFGDWGSKDEFREGLLFRRTHRKKGEG